MTVSSDREGLKHRHGELKALGISLDEVTGRLLKEGLDAFEKAYILLLKGSRKKDSHCQADIFLLFLSARFDRIGGAPYNTPVVRRGYSSAGRAPEWHSKRFQGFESP